MGGEKEMKRIMIEEKEEETTRLLYRPSDSKRDVTRCGDYKVAGIIKIPLQ